MKTLVIGLGNPILRDDGAGIYIARMLQKVLPLDAEVDIVELCTGGLQLMEAMIGYEYVIIADTLWASEGETGHVVVFDSGHLPETMNSTNLHDSDLPTALSVGRKLGAVLPARQNIQIVAVTARNVLDFGTELTPAVAAALPEAVQHILEKLGCEPVIDLSCFPPANHWRL